MTGIKLLGKLPQSCYVAVSGGMDSMFALDFLRNGRKDITVLTFNHGTEFGNQAEQFIIDYCESHSIPYHLGNIGNNVKRKGQSQEEFWRCCRYEFFSKYTDKPMIMAHHLDDAIETHLYTSIKYGVARAIPYKRDNVLRPFLATKREDIERWVKRKKVPYVEDMSNADTKYMRNHIRHNMMPMVLKINSGIHKTVLKQHYSDYINA